MPLKHLTPRSPGTFLNGVLEIHTSVHEAHAKTTLILASGLEGVEPRAHFSGQGLTWVWRPGSAWTCPQPFLLGFCCLPELSKLTPSSMAHACHHSRPCSHISTEPLSSLISSEI